MTIAKGQPWGAPGRFPADGVVVHSDAEARAVVSASMREQRAVPTIGLLGGDLCRTVGGRGDETRLRSDEAMTLPIDIGSVMLGGERHWFVAHLVARTRSWSTVALTMNAQWLGPWDMAPKAHPNDGLLDAVQASLSVSDRLKARRRLPLGTHVPHPGIETRRSAAHRFGFPRALDVWLDGERIGSARELEVTLLPDAIRIVV